MVLAFAWIPLRVPSEEGTRDDRLGSEKFFYEVVKSTTQSSITIRLFYSILLYGKAFLLLLNMLKTLAMTNHFFVRDDMT